MCATRDTAMKALAGDLAGEAPVEPFFRRSAPASIRALLNPLQRTGKSPYTGGLSFLETI